MSTRPSQRCAAFLIASSLLPVAAQSQSDDGKGTTQLQSVQVTAERHKQDAKDVPVSATVISPEQLDTLELAGQDVRVLAAKVPSLNIESSNGRTFPRFYIRGYGNTDFSTYASQPVSLVYDDVVQESPILKGFPMFDMESVEVLRGPQGTLFGRNTPAGVVKFNSVKPSLGANDGYVSLSDGTYNTANFDGAVSIPLSAEWAARVAAQEQYRDNWVTNYDGRKLEGYKDSAARVQLLYQPNDDFNALFNVHGHYLRGTARLFRANIIEPGSNNLVPGFHADKSAIDGGNEQVLATYGGSVSLNWKREDVSLHSITGYEAIPKYFTRGDIDGGYGAVYAPPYGPGVIPFSVETAGGVRDHKQFTQEFRAESDLTGPWQWQAGVYYFYEDIEGESYTYDRIYADGALSSFDLTEQRNTSWAGFGSLSFQATDALNLRAGVRWTYDTKTFKVLELQNETIAGPLSRSASGSKVTGDLSAVYVIDPAVNVYARVASGFRGASFGAPSATAPITVAKPETDTSYEVGIKSDLFDRRARLSFDIYRYTVKNQQLTAVGGTSNDVRLLNAKKTIGRGAEMDFEALLTPHLRVNAGASYNFTRIEDPSLSVGVCAMCTVTDPINAQGNAEIDGNPLPQAPKWIADVGARYGIPMGNNGELYASTDWSFRSEVNFFLYESKEFTGKPLLEGGAKIGYSWLGGKYDVSVFCRNCTNQIRVTGGIDFDNLTGFINDPRIYGVQFRVNF